MPETGGDWAGQTAFLKEKISGEAIPDFVFVATYIESLILQLLTYIGR
ncbi:hypothetical protein [Bacillus sp. UNC41MFS5]|nr:hypothetical protein [Bacillus sp. UNC41MFS5]